VSALRSGTVTGLATLAVAGSAAGAGVLLAQLFGRNERTDGLLVAYGVYLVLAIAAQSFRLVVLPGLTLAAADATLGAETRSYLLALTAAGGGVVAATVLFADPLGRALTADPTAAQVAAQALPWLAAAGFLQLVGALLASALAARNSYEVAALAYAFGAVLALVMFAAFHDRGEVSLAWAVFANSVFVVALPLVVLWRAGALQGSRLRGDALQRLGRLASGAAVPIALQTMFVVALRVAGGLGVGSTTSLNYGYLVAGVLVAATASSLALISSAPLTRRGLDVEGAMEHVIHSAWLSLVLIAAAAGVFALVGGRFVGPLLGGAYAGEVGDELGRLVTYLAPWMVLMAVYTVTFPLLFVLERPRRLAAIAVGGLALSAPILLAGRALGGLAGIAGALALSAAIVLTALLLAVSGWALRRTAAELARLSATVGVLAAVAFGLGSLLGGVPGPVLGLALYAALLAARRPQGLREAWAYFRDLHS
jgi:O-antigen/teichoic acid export membrane protein